MTDQPKVEWVGDLSADDMLSVLYELDYGIERIEAEPLPRHGDVVLHVHWKDGRQETRLIEDQADVSVGACRQRVELRRARKPTMIYQLGVRSGAEHSDPVRRELIEKSLAEMDEMRALLVEQWGRENGGREPERGD